MIQALAAYISRRHARIHASSLLSASPSRRCAYGCAASTYEGAEHALTAPSPKSGDAAHPWVHRRCRDRLTRSRCRRRVDPGVAPPDFGVRADDSGARRLHKSAPRPDPLAVFNSVRPRHGGAPMDALRRLTKARSTRSRLRRRSQETRRIHGCTVGAVTVSHVPDADGEWIPPSRLMISASERVITRSSPT